MPTKDMFPEKKGLAVLKEKVSVPWAKELLKERRKNQPLREKKSVPESRPESKGQRRTGGTIYERENYFE